MPSDSNVYGVLTPVGGGDPIALQQTEVIVGRRASCDVCLDYTNVSGKHCKLRLVNNVWHVRDLGSSNGTTLNGATLLSEHSVMPDDEIGIATHIFRIDYEPAGPETFVTSNQAIDEELTDAKKRTSLMELAGLDTDEKATRHRARPTRAPELIQRLSADEADFDDALPEHVKKAPKPVIQNNNDDDFLKLIDEDVKKSE
jgi:pSer/pThr/pTyr-binding forkhead associated (FHA) protein